MSKDLSSVEYYRQLAAGQGKVAYFAGEGERFLAGRFPFASASAISL